MESTGSYLAVIKVVGVGRGGANAVTRMVDAGLRGGECIAANTDAQALALCAADIKGAERARQASEGIERLREVVDTLIVIPNAKLLTVVERRTSMIDAFREV